MEISLFSLKSECIEAFCITFQKAIAGQANKSYIHHLKVTPCLSPLEIHITGNFILQNQWE